MDDLISRQEAIMALVFSNDTGDMTCGQMVKVLNVIKAVPSAQSERKKGIWIKAFRIPLDTKHNDISFDRFMCSNCTAQTNRMTDFCPNCGADMREEKDNG